MLWINDHWISMLTPEYTKPPVEKTLLQLLANQTADQLSHIQTYISKLI